MKADVCLIVEGTYPYVTGGVSAWIHQLIDALPEIRFALFHIGATAGEEPTPVYELPANVLEFVNVGIHGGDEAPQPSARAPEATWESVRAFHDEMRDNHEGGLAALLQRLSPQPGRGPSPHDFLYSKPAWNILRAIYEDRAPDVSFLDYFWTWRFTHLPIFRLLHAALPEASVYHTVSTGWAGLVAAVARARTGRPMLLTEHGIYARERRMEIDQADWIYVQRQLPMTLNVGPGFFKELWARLFYRLSRLTYAHADLIVTIFEGNRQAQIHDGADPARTLVIPNGVVIGRFAGLDHVAAAPGGFRVGFVGRVVPIKDVKTFIRAIKIVAGSLPGVRATLVGPVDEDEEYAAECRTLTATLDLEEHVTFVGTADVRAFYREMDVLVLTSISEGLPLVILEAFAAGVPVISTDVGACRELLEGRGGEDRALGPSGLVTGLANPAATAEAILTLARDPGLREEMANAGRARVRKFYDESDLVRRYRDLYRRLIAAPAGGAETG
jgi:glycosyltransferase involved in cell wall biosynthesis